MFNAKNFSLTELQTKKTTINQQQYFSGDYDRVCPDLISASQRSTKLRLLAAACSMLLPDLKSRCALFLYILTGSPCPSVLQSVLHQPYRCEYFFIFFIRCNFKAFTSFIMQFFPFFFALFNFSLLKFAGYPYFFSFFRQNAS